MRSPVLHRVRPARENAFSDAVLAAEIPSSKHRSRNLAESWPHSQLSVGASWQEAPCGAGAPLFPLVHLLPHLFPFLLFPFFIGFTYFLLLSIPSLSTRIVPLRFQAEGRRRRPNLGLVCVLFCNLCYLYFLVKMDCGVLFYLV